MITPTINGVKTYPDGREVCVMKLIAGKREYRARTYAMVARQMLKCAICFRHLFYALSSQFDHEDGRGSGGAHRDDRITNPDGTWRNAALCEKCNTLKGSKRYKWIEGTYQEVSR